MAFASILVHAGLDQTSDPRIQLAVDLADGFNATLIGIAGWGKLCQLLLPTVRSSTVKWRAIL